MKLKITTIVSCLLCQSLTLPILQPQFGILASNSNEILGFNGLMLSGIGFGQTQTAPLLPSFGIQSDLVFPPQLVPLNPQLTGPFLSQASSVLLPAQGYQLPSGFLPPSQQEQSGLPQDSTVARQSQQGFNQMLPQYYPSIPFLQWPGGQGFPYYFSYGYPQLNPSLAQQQPSKPVPAQQNLEQTTETPNFLPQTATVPQGQGETGNTGRDFGMESDHAVSRRGDSTGTEGPDLSFMFEP